MATETTNLSKINRDKMLATIKAIKEQTRDNIEIVNNLSAIENELTKKKYGLIWEEHEERVDLELKTQIPIFKEIKELEITNDKNQKYNFLLEGDNLHSLYLLKKTHRGKIDVIYIDPPYNTQKDGFIYDDIRIDLNDMFRHSKWLSFMAKRLTLAKELLAPFGFIYISIDDNEFASLRLLCDDIFGIESFVGTVTWEKRTKCQNTQTAKKMFQSKTEYILMYKNTPNRVDYNLQIAGSREYPSQDESGQYREETIGQMSSSGMRGRNTMIFSILGVLPKEGYQWKIGKETVSNYEKRGDLFLKDNKPCLKIRKEDEVGDKLIPFWSHFFDKDTYGTAETGKTELSNILGTKDHNFETVKPTELIKKLLLHIPVTNDNFTVLDFFAGSGTTGQAVMELNENDNLNRKFILCTNDENDICMNITYKRLKNIISGYTNLKSENIEGISANLKHLKTDYIPRLDTDDMSLEENLLKNIKTLIELENAIIVDNKKIRVFFSEEDIENLIRNKEELDITEKIYISSNILLSSQNEIIFEESNINIYTIPEYYFKDEIMEVEEQW